MSRKLAPFIGGRDKASASSGRLQRYKNNPQAFAILNTLRAIWETARLSRLELLGNADLPRKG